MFEENTSGLPLLPDDLTRTSIRRNLEQLRGGRFQVASADSWVARRKVTNMERPDGEPVSVLLFDRQIHAPSNTRYTRVARRLETHQAVQDCGTVEISFDPATQRLVVHAVSVFRSGTLTNHATLDAFELLQREATLEADVLTGSVTALLLVKDLRVADILDLEFSIVSDNGLFGDHYWISEAVEGAWPIGRQWLSWIGREGQPLFVTAPGHRGTETTEITEHGTVRTWQFVHTPAVRVEPDLPADFRPFDEVFITTFPDWGSVAGLFLEPWNKAPNDRSALDGELVVLRGLFEAAPEDGILAAVDFVRHNVRYLGYSPGMMALVPADPGVVWDRRFGDCKEKTRLLCWILRELGVEADPVLVHSVIGNSIPHLPPCPSVFNHVVTRVRHRGVEWWIDPTDVARRGTLEQWTWLPFQYGLPLIPGSDRIVPIPGAPDGFSGLAVEELITVGSGDRGADIVIVHTYRGSEADGVRHLIDSRGRSAIAEYLTEQVKRTRRNAQPTSDLEVVDDCRANTVVLRRHFHCEELLTASPDGGTDMVFLIPYSIPQRISGVSSQDRKHPLGLAHPVDVKHTIRINSPNPRAVQIPEHRVTNGFFKFSFVSSCKRQETIHVFSYASRADRIPASHIHSYAKDLGRVSEALDWHIRFPRRRGIVPRRFPRSGPGAW